MSIAAEVNQRLARITELGTSIWLDQIRLNLIESGELQRLVERDSLRGVTSNPAIFEKAILGSDDYDELIAEAAEAGMNTRDIYERVAVKTVQDACDVLRPIWDASEGADGFVSIEVEPDIAFDTDKTIESARHYWEAVDRPNVMIKIPGTLEGAPAIEQAISEGINVNVTLLFSVEAYEQVAEAYIKGLERRKAAGEPLTPQSVASFFVSRVDTEVDKRLDALGRPDLKGTAAVANARAAYQSFKKIFHGSERWQQLADAGARVQRPLWASTGVKDPSYPETKYVDTLVGPDTVNTMPMNTLVAAGEQSEVSSVTVDADPTAELEALREAGIDMEDVTGKLLKDGVDAFITPFEKLMAGIESAREGQVTGRPKTIEASIPDELEPALRARVEQARKDDVARRVWHKDVTLWGGTPDTPELGNRLGWLTIAGRMMDQCGALTEFAAECRGEFTDVVLCGMGGSSLAPEVLRQSFPDANAMRVHVLDSTDPAAIAAVEAEIEPDRTLFLISSKSGGTIETLSQYRYFRSKVSNARNFAAITDPGSALAELGEKEGFRRVFLNDPEIGGRYSALSYFGLVPAALQGIDVKALLDTARTAEENCNQLDASSDNSGLWLGLAMGELALQGRDKLTFVVDEPVASFGLWVEQLIAESTGKEGKGILPVADEPLSDDASVYGDDRVFVHLKTPESERSLDHLVKAGQPVVTLTVNGPEDLGRVFFFAEFATAVAGWVLGINPFDQPNVQQAKDATAKVLEEGVEEPGSDELDLGAYGPPHYVAIQGFVQPSEEFDAAIAELRAAIRDRTKATTTFGYGPRYLHSTGQFHKGGPPTGVFVQLVHDSGDDIEIPDAGYTFSTLKNAQALGDLNTLKERGLPVQRIRLEGDPAQAVRDLIGRVD